MKQKDVFLGGEGNAWFTRNAAAMAKHEMPGSDPLLMELLCLKDYFTGSVGPVNVLEVGCGPGLRLDWLQQQMGWECYGVEPSDEAVKQATFAGIHAQVGTADQPPFVDKSFDMCHIRILSLPLRS